MNTLWRKIQASLLIIGAVGGLLLESTEQCKAVGESGFTPYYDYYFSYYQLYSKAYTQSNNPYYLNLKYAYYYYYLAGYYADYYGFYNDPSGNKSDKRVNPRSYSSISNHDTYWDNYARMGDYYYRIYNSVTSR